MRTKLSWMLDKTATHERATKTIDAVGGITRTWATVASSIACALWLESSVVPPAVEAERRTAVRRFQIATESELSWQIDDRLVIDGAYYAILSAAPYVNSNMSTETVHVYNCEQRTY